MHKIIDSFIHERLINSTYQNNLESAICNERKKEILSLIGILKENKLFMRYEELSNINANELLIDTYKQGFIEGIEIYKEFTKIAQGISR